ncbi:MAG: HlyD family efflux transporter periplasmic adaptor subunit [Planctomycetota bacterium]
MTLTRGRPRTETRATGVVEAYRRSDLGIDVGGRLTFIAELGADALGPQFDGSGELLRDADGGAVRVGDVVATIDRTRYLEAVTAAELALQSTERERESSQLQLERVLTARLENARASYEAARSDVQSARDEIIVAEAQLDLARTSVERDRSLIESGGIAQSVLDSSESEFRTAVATLSQARSSLDSSLQNERSALATVNEAQGQIDVEKADLLQLDAQLAEKRSSLRSAQTDLESCTLRAPFSGRITRIDASVGAYVSPGQTLMELTLLSPVKVVLTASAEQERTLPVGAGVPVYADQPSNRTSSRVGTVYEKSGVADERTRTFRIGLIVPNDSTDPLGGTASGARRSAQNLFPVLSMPEAPAGALYVNVNCAVERGQRTVVLRIPGFNSEARERATNGVVIPEEVTIQLDDDWRQVDLWTFRGLASNNLSRGDALVLNPRPEDLSGVRIGSLAYAMRPGDVVEVGLDSALPPEGLWVPESAVVVKSGQARVFVVDGGTCREAPVDVLDASGTRRRIVGPAVADGASVVVRGAPFLSDGDPVEIIEDGSRVGR